MDHCQRCGICCRKGGPAIHQEDKFLLENGHIQLRFLFTIRTDEPVFDNVQGHIIPAPADIIRVKGQKAFSTCVFFNPEQNHCSIYDHRPLECRVLKCWDTNEIIKIYQTGRLSRKDLFRNIPHINHLVEYHENRCAYREIKKLIDRFDHHKNRATLNALREIIAFDNHFRSLIAEKSLFKMDTMDFLFGFSLQTTLPRMGFQISQSRP